MIATVLDYLKSDTELVTMLNHRQEHSKITAYEAFDKYTYPYAIVTLTPSKMGIMTEQSNCEIRIATDDKLLFEDLTRKVKSLLHFGNKPGFQLNNETILHSKHTGGGFLFDEEKHVFEQVLLFNMTFKRKG